MAPTPAYSWMQQAQLRHQELCYSSMSGLSQISRRETWPYCSSSQQSSQTTDADFCIPGCANSAASTCLQNFVVAGGTATGTIAVITQPLSYIPASPGGLTTILLDATNSSPKPGASLTQYVWAIISMPAKRPLANATGRVAQARLPSGSYQLGLLVLDSGGGSAIAQKNFVVGIVSLQETSLGSSVNTGSGQGTSQPTSSDPNDPPELIDLAQPLEGVVGGRVSLPAISDADADPVSAAWELKRGNQVVSSGSGSIVSLAKVPAGSYVVSVTASDGKVTATGSYQLKVKAVSSVTGASEPAAGSTGTGTAGTGSIAGAPAAPAAQQPPQLTLRLASLTLPQGAVLEIDAGAAGVPLKDLARYSYKWRLSSKATGQTVTTQTGLRARLVLSTADSLQLELSVTAATGGPATAGSCNLKVLPQAEGSAALPSTAGSCGPFKSNPTANTTLICSQVVAKVGGSAGVAAVPFTEKLVWAWRVTRLKDQSVTTRIGAAASLGRLAEGVFVIEAALGVRAPPTSTNTIYFLSSYMIVSAPASPAAATASALRQAAPSVAPAPKEMTPHAVWQQWDAIGNHQV